MIRHPRLGKNLMWLCNPNGRVWRAISVPTGLTDRGSGIFEETVSRFFNRKGNGWLISMIQRSTRFL